MTTIVDAIARLRDLFPDARLPSAIPDGRLIRFPVDARDTKRCGWIVAHQTPHGPLVIGGSWRTGERHVLRPDCADADPARRAAVSAAFEAARRRHERAAAAAAASAAGRARRLFLRATRSSDYTNHNWATRKRLAHPLWHVGRNLAVPLYNAEGQLVSAQLIAPDGGRRFLAGSRVAGASYTIGQLDGAEHVLVCEGIATGDALAQATHLPVVCAMSASNLETVARHLRRRLPDSRITIVADNDARLDARGLTNPGLAAARTAASAAGAWLACPPQPGTDANDVFCELGPAALRAIVDAAEPPPTAAASSAAAAKRREQADDSLTGLFRMDAFGRPRRDVDNVARFVRHYLANRLVYDLFTGELTLDHSRDHVAERVLAELFATCPDVSWTPEVAHQGLAYAVATGAVATHDSLRAALDEIEPATQDEPDWFYLAVSEGLRLAEDYDVDLAAATVRAWMTGVVGRILEPGSKLDFALVLVGPQGVGKSSLAKCLALRPQWFTDGLSLHRLDEKDERMLLRGVQIVESSELSGLNRADLNSVKKFLTQTEDSYRPPYGRTIERWPRRFGVVCTTNDDAFLRDTENRRFGIIRIADVNLAWFAEHLRHLYAAARAAWQAGEQPVLPDAAASAMRAEHERAAERDPWEHVILEIAECRSQFSTDDVLDRLGVPLERRTRADVTRIGALVRRLLPEHAKAKTSLPNGRRAWVWRAPMGLRRGTTAA